MQKLIANLHASALHVNLHGQTQVLNGAMTMDNAPPLSRQEMGEWEAMWQHESIASRSMHALSSCQELVQAQPVIRAASACWVFHLYSGTPLMQTPFRPQN